MIDQAAPSKGGSICFLTAAYPAPSDPTRGIFIQNWIRALVDLGYSGCVVAPQVKKTDPLQAFESPLPVSRFPYSSSGLRLKEIEKPSKWMLMRYLMNGFRETIKACRRESAELIYAHWVLPTGLIGAWAAKWLNIPLIVHAHGSDLLQVAPKSSLSRFLTKATLDRASLCFGVSEELLQVAMREFSLDPDKAIELSMGLPKDQFTFRGREEARRELNFDSTKLEVVYIGDLDPKKGILSLAQQWAGEEWILDQARLHIIGQGQDRIALEDLSQLHPHSILTYGRKDPSEVAKFHRSADLLVLPSESEGSPLVVMEALHSGTPVLSSRVGNIPKLLNEGQYGWALDDQSYVETLKFILDDRQKLNNLRSDIERDFADQPLSIESRAQQVSAMISSLLEERNPDSQSQPFSESQCSS